MNNYFNNLKSRLVFKYFEEISNIPRGSANEKGISDYLVKFAKKRNLEVIQDKSLNVIIKKPATQGYEKCKTVILQGHVDMVCEKNKLTEHDFNRDPIKLRIDEDMIYATNTTLGADDGIAVAYALAILDSDEICHPAIEVLMTTEEETSMAGALNIDFTNLKGEVLINIDSDREGELLVSSAGGITTKQVLPIIWQDTPPKLKAFSLCVGGLKGGHSGAEIHKGRGNSNIILGRILDGLYKENSFYICEINGGLKSNAIPREAEAVILINPDDTINLENEIKKWDEIIKKELQTSDKGVFIRIKPMENKIDKVFSRDTMKKAIASLILIPNGIQSMSMDIEGLVESSTNLGAVSTNISEMYFESDIRSAVSSLRDNILNRARKVANILECELIEDGLYPEWAYNKDSKIRVLFEEIYKKQYGIEPKVLALHCGLECGVFLEKNPKLDIISYGPNVYDIHTPDEHMSISSIERTWEYFLEILKEMKGYNS